MIATRIKYFGPVIWSQWVISTGWSNRYTDFDQRVWVEEQPISMQNLPPWSIKLSLFGFVGLHMRNVVLTKKIGFIMCLDTKA